MNQHVRCRVPWDNSYGDKLRKIFVTFGAESDSSLLTVSLGKHPSNEQQAPAPSLFSPGMANALQYVSLCFFTRESEGPSQTF